MQYLIEKHNDHPKAARLITVAGRLGMDLSGYGELALNSKYKNIYLWLEDYSFCLFIDKDDNLKALYTCFIDGTEILKDVSDSTTLDELDKWAMGLHEKSEGKE